MSNAPVMACMICKKPNAAYGVGWPGHRADQPPAVAGKRVRICTFNGECHAQAIVRAVKAARRPWPWRGPDEPDLRARVDELLGQPPPAKTTTPPMPPSTEKRPRESAQGNLF